MTRTARLTMGDEVDLEDLLAALPAEELANLVDEMAADPDDKHMPANVRTAYRCEKDPTGLGNEARTSTAPTVHRPQHPPSKCQDQAGERVHPAQQETAGAEGGL